YTYNVFRAEPHPHFAGKLHVRPPHLWLPAYVALSGIYQPLGAPSTGIIARLVQAGRIQPERRQPTSTLIVRPPDGPARTFLLRWNADWGYALPAKRREASDPGAGAAERVAREELGLEPGTDVLLQPARVPLFKTHGVSKTQGPPAHGAATE